MKKIVAQFYKNGKLQIEVVALLPFKYFPGRGRVFIRKGRFPDKKINNLYPQNHKYGEPSFRQSMEAKANDFNMELRYVESGEYEEPPPDDGTHY